MPRLKKLGSTKSLGVSGSVVACAMFAAAPLSASVYNWTGADPSSNPGWTRNGNWSTVSAPPNNGSADIVYTTAPATASTVDIDYAIDGLSFSAAAPAYIVDASSTATLSIGAGGIVDGSSALETVSASINSSTAQTWSTNNAVGNLLVSGAVGGTGPLTIAGAGTVTFTGTNTYTGGTVLNSGTLAISGEGGADSALGDAAGSLTFNGGTLRVFGPPAGITSRDINLNAAGGTLRIDSDFFLSGTLNGTGTLTKTGDATLSILGDSGSSFGGAVDLSRGGTTLYSYGDQPLGTGNVALRGGANLSVLGQIAGSTSSPFTTTTPLASGGTFTYGAGGGLIAPATASTDGGSILNVTLGGNTDGIAPNLVRSGRGTLIVAPFNGTASSNLGVLENVTVVGAAGNLPAVTHGIVSPSIVAQDNDGNATGDFLTYDASGGFVSAAGSYTNGITSNAAQIANVITPTVVSSNTTAFAVRINNVSVTNAPGVTLTVGDGSSAHEAGIIFNGTGSTITGGTLAAGASEAVIYTAQSATINSAVTGSNGLTAFGPGTLTLTGPASYTGPTTINGVYTPGSGPSGTLHLASTGTISGGGAVAVNPYATFDVRGRVTGAGAVTVDGTLTGNGFITGPVNVDAGAAIIPGTGTLPSLLSTGSLTLINGSTATFGLSSTGSDSISVVGSVVLGDATLNVEPIAADSALIGTTYVLINNDGVDSVTGTFMGLAQGATFTTSDGEQFAISYTGDAAADTFAGAGNDVMLQAVSASVPEPGIATAAAVLFSIASVYRRRRPVQPALLTQAR